MEVDGRGRVLHGNATESDCGSIKDIFNDPCPRHSTAKCEFYCECHDEVCCGICVMLLHKKCEKPVHLPETTDNANSAYAESNLFLNEILNKVSKQKQILDNLSDENTEKQAAVEKDVKAFRATTDCNLDTKTSEQVANINIQYELNQEKYETILKKNTNLKDHLKAELNDIDYFTSNKQPARVYLKLETVKVDEIRAQAKELNELQPECKTSLLFAFKPGYNIQSSLIKSEVFGNVSSSDPSLIESRLSISKAKVCCLNIMRNHESIIKILFIIFLLLTIQTLMLSVHKDQVRYFKSVYVPAELLIQSGFSGLLSLYSVVLSGCITMVSEIFSGFVWGIYSVKSGLVWLIENIIVCIVWPFHMIYVGFAWLKDVIYSGWVWLIDSIIFCFVWPIHKISLGLAWLKDVIFSGCVWLIDSIIICFVWPIHKISLGLAWLKNDIYSSFVRFGHIIDTALFWFCFSMVLLGYVIAFSMKQRG